MQVREKVENVDGKLQPLRFKDKLVNALQHYVQDEQLTFDSMLQEIGLEPTLKQLKDGQAAQLDIILNELELERLDKMEEWLNERKKISIAYPSKNVAMKTVGESAKSSVVPTVIATLIGGPIVGGSVFLASSFFHQGSQQLTHREESTKRAEELLESIARIRILKNDYLAQDSTEVKEENTNNDAIGSPTKKR